MAHDQNSWTRIMLQNTALLTDVKEQQKFWTWICNPDEEERAPLEFEVFDKRIEVNMPDLVTVQVTNPDDEKTNEVTLSQTYKINGMSCYTTQTPV